MEKCVLEWNENVRYLNLGIEWKLMSIPVFIDAQVAVATLLIHSTSIWLSLPFSCSDSHWIVLRYLAVLSVVV